MEAAPGKATSDAAAPDEAAPDEAAHEESLSEEGGGARAGAGEPFAVRVRVTWRDVWLLVASLILLAASAAFVAGGVTGGATLGGVMFSIFGFAGLALFGTGLFLSAGQMAARRPVLELDADGVRRTARWPLPRRAGKTLPWADVQAIAALRRGLDGTRRGELDYVVFLRTPELVEMARTSGRPQLVAMTMRDVPVTAEAVQWCFAVERNWDANLPRIVKEARARHRVPVIDRRTK
ncbi:hypothetical protein [Actinomadura livida]|uniref:Uncharacterized protein n=1 Tax=Actinomadura livida TaxID=79909 RepID=A0A7W7IAF6_9ACTN|nr:MULTISPECIES: hypothetical protein [Actinomadura]MBB4773440.1 putative protein tyrosine phosphatase [Actinomadura catellatispora]GGU08254.1 hypothetical protein GCM10010208_35780 [Actinomadura livida]